MESLLKALQSANMKDQNQWHRHVLRHRSDTFYFESPNRNDTVVVAAALTLGKCIWWNRILPSPRTLTGDNPARIIRTAGQQPPCSPSAGRSGAVTSLQRPGPQRKKMNESELSSPPAEYDFERRFDERRALEWMQENWSKSFMFCGLYAALVFGGQHFMRERPKLNLRRPLVLWSLSLAIFSIIGAVRTGLYMLHVLTTSGFKQSVCDTSFYSAPVTKFWAYAFVLSKAPELGDTVFIVLRKQRLIFLHWYHHITVLLYSWYSYKDQVAGGGWFMTMNYVVHSLMYTYYAARAAGLRVPRPCAMIITFTQILQMVMGLAVLGLVYRWMHEVRCPSYMDNIAWGSLMYLSYLVLFAVFFYNSYLKGSSGDKGSKAE